jgi:hypothetical protein
LLLRGAYYRPLSDALSLFFHNSFKPVETFGNIADKKPCAIISPDQKEAVLPLSAFSNNYLTITKPASEMKLGCEFNLPLTYNLENGESGGITSFRAAIRKIGIV